MELKSHRIKDTQNYLLMFLLLVFPFTATPQSQSFIDVGVFSKERIENRTTSHWKPLTFKNIERHTTYTLVKDGEDAVLEAVSEASASGLTREIKIDPKQYPRAAAGREREGEGGDGGDGDGAHDDLPFFQFRATRNP